MKSDESCILNPRSEICNWTTLRPVRNFGFRIGDGLLSDFTISPSPGYSRYVVALCEEGNAYQKISGTENVKTLLRRMSEMMTSLFFGFNTTPKGFLSVVLGPMGIFHFGGTSPLSS